MPKIPSNEPLIGRVFGELTIIAEAPRNPKCPANRQWSCRCSCGKIKVFSTSQVAHSKSGTCGHGGKGVNKANRDIVKELGIALDEATYIISFYGIYRVTAQKAGRTFELSLGQFFKLIKQDCSYCGIAPTKRVWSTRSLSALVNGVDRIDSEKGYTLDNTTTACAQCNIAKSDYTTTEFKAWLQRIVDHAARKVD